jgi:hypothetical protein
MRGQLSLDGRGLVLRGVDADEVHVQVGGYFPVDPHGELLNFDASGDCPITLAGGGVQRCTTPGSALHHSSGCLRRLEGEREFECGDKDDQCPPSPHQAQIEGKRGGAHKSGLATQCG